MTLVMSRGIALTATGVVLGVFIAWMVTRAMQTLLFGVKAGDPATFGIVLGLLATVAVIACAIPAIRAARVDPMVALRDQ
jgi:ABC-type antimicrobial peptide transport system permease subunit